MTVFQGAVDATFAAFGIDAVYTQAGGDSVPVKVIARRRTRSLALRDAHPCRDRELSSCGRARSQTLGPVISSSWAGRRSSSRASRSGAIPTGCYGASMYVLPDRFSRSWARARHHILNELIDDEPRILELQSCRGHMRRDVSIEARALGPAHPRLPQAGQ